MKKIEAIVRPEVIEDIKTALFAANVEGMTISQVQGAGNQHGWTEYYRGTEVLVQMRAKVKIEIVLPDDRIDDVCQIILLNARTGQTGEVGDGKIFIYPVLEAIRIHTGERGDDAILTARWRRPSNKAQLSAKNVRQPWRITAKKSSSCIVARYAA